MKILVLLCIIAFSNAQNIPLWLEVQLSDENTEKIYADMEDLQHQLSKDSDFETLSAALYFVPDELITFYLNNDPRLESADRQFLDEFFLRQNPILLDQFLLLRSSANTDSLLNSYLGSNTRLKTATKVQWQMFQLDLFTQKAKYEAYFSTINPRLSFTYEALSVSLGFMRFKRINPLIFSTSYGETFYEGLRPASPSAPSVSAQSSLNAQNTLHGAAISYRFNSDFRVLYALGQQHYFVSDKNSRFQSINYYQPEIESDQFSKKLNLEENTHLLVADYQATKELRFQSSFLTQHYSYEFEKLTDYQSLRFDQAKFLGLQTAYKTKAFAVVWNLATQLSYGSANDVYVRLKSQKSRLDLAYFNYSPHFINLRSTALWQGVRRAENSRGTSAVASHSYNTMLTVFFGLQQTEDIQAEQFESPLERSKKSFYGIEGRIQKFSYKLKVKNVWKESTQFTLSYKFSRKSSLSTHWYFYGHFKNTYQLLNFRYQFMQIGFGNVNTNQTIQVYQTGLYREFLTASYNTNTLFGFFKFSHDFADLGKIQFIWQSRYTKNEDTIKNSTEKINSKFNNEFALSYSLSL